MTRQGSKKGSAWDGLLEKRRSTVASASFTPSTAARKSAFGLPAGAHEREMFASVADACIAAVATAFVQTRDDVLVLKVGARRDDIYVYIPKYVYIYIIYIYIYIYI